MVRQYPYVLEVLTFSGGGLDNNGNPIAPVKHWIPLSRCRDEAGNGKVITATDGVQYQYSVLVQMPKGVEALKFGSEVRVTQGNEIRAKGTVIYSREDQLHTRAWL